MRLFVVSIVCVLLALSFPGIDSKVVKKFTNCSEFFLNKMLPVIPGILEKPEPKTENFKVICQKFKNKIRFATLYDTTGKIPVFSAYKYTGTGAFNRSQNIWMTESQLEPVSTAECEPFVTQARNEDYWINNPYNYILGTLFPNTHAADEETAQSTYTLTNSVPQNNKFKENIWNQMETKMKEYMDNNCKDHNKKIVAYVLTGVIPGNEMLNERVNIPSHMWTAFCCYNTKARSYVSKTYFTTNQRHDAGNIIKLKSLEDLLTFLKKNWEKEVKLFDQNCK